MPRRATSTRTDRSSKKKHARNVKVKTELKKSIKKFLSLVAAKDLKEAKATLIKTFSLLDKAAKKAIIHPNTANRRKSRLSTRLAKSA